MSGNFFDSNVLLYVTSLDQIKADRVRVLLGSGGTISVQVLNEIAHVALRKFRMSWADTKSFLSTISDLLMVEPLTTDTHATGLRLAERYGFAIYDSMIVAAAVQADCDTLWSEDMQDGLMVEKRLRIVNPFA
ncbi:MAG TPA: PIN domain-containing protein [Bradyrhizobium sp.]|jgi:predicted nucleic acid-binding protein|nr:PIN domain-containing protein [Bradyrhizobium sp.]